MTADLNPNFHAWLQTQLKAMADLTREVTTMEPTARERAEKRLAEVQEAYRKAAAKAARAIERRGRAEAELATAQVELDRLRATPQEPTGRRTWNVPPGMETAELYPAVMFTRRTPAGTLRTYVALRVSSLTGRSLWWISAGPGHTGGLIPMTWEKLLAFMGDHGRATLHSVNVDDWNPLR